MNKLLVGAVLGSAAFAAVAAAISAMVLLGRADDTAQAGAEVGADGPALEFYAAPLNSTNEADMKILSQEFVDPPTEIEVCESVPVTVRKVVHNNGPYGPVGVELAKFAEASSGCTASDGDTVSPNLPSAGIDEFWSKVTAQFIVDLDSDGVPETNFGTKQTEGPTVVQRSGPGDSDGDTLTDIETEIVSMDLAGDVMHIAEDPAQTSEGLVEALSPTADFPADSFFDVSLLVDTPAGHLHSQLPAHLAAAVQTVPPYFATYVAASDILLYDGSGDHRGTLSGLTLEVHKLVATAPLDVSVSSTINESIVIHCLEPGEKTFTIHNRCVRWEVPDPNTTNCRPDPTPLTVTVPTPTPTPTPPPTPTATPPPTPTLPPTPTATPPPTPTLPPTPTATPPPTPTLPPTPTATPPPTPTPTPTCAPPGPIDIKPGSCPNSINLDCRGVVPVAVLTTESFDAATVDPSTVVFADAQPKNSALDDVDQDGDLDLILHFKCQDLNIEPDAQEACLSGYTYSGAPISGCDSVRIVPPDSAADSDADGFSDPVEICTQTDPLDDCPDVLGTPGLCPGDDCDGDDAWPPDLDVDRDADVVDVITFREVILNDAKYHPRWDLDADGDIDVVDAMKYKGVILTSCVP